MTEQEREKVLDIEKYSKRGTAEAYTTFICLATAIGAIQLGDVLPAIANSYPYIAMLSGIGAGAFGVSSLTNKSYVRQLKNEIGE